MENRERDKTSKSNQSASAGDLDRKTAKPSSADRGKKAGFSGNMKEPNSRGGNSGQSGFSSSDKGASGNSREMEPRSRDDNDRSGSNRQ